MTPLSDRTLFVEKPTKKGSVFVEYRTSQEKITAIRLEVLTDPQTGQARARRRSNGNFVLNEFRLRVASASEPTKFKDVKLKSGRADFSQVGFDANLAVDGNTQAPNGWAVYPETQKEHWATFQLEAPLETVGKTLQFELVHNLIPTNIIWARFVFPSQTPRSRRD